MERKHNPELTPLAKKLRKSLTKEERHLWYDFLSSYSVRFLRQKVIGKYIVDFYCAEALLVVELDGSQTVRAFGKGRNKSDAVEQAKKNAVYAVIFTGIRGGVQGCDMRPLVNEPNARDKYEEYFNIFFLDDGAYKEYVSMEDAKRRSKDKTTNKYVKNYTVTVRVLRAELKARLRADGILP